MVRGVPFPVIRVFFLAMVAVVASSYALVRYYTHPRSPIVVVAPAPDNGEIPAPDLEPVTK